MGVALWVRAKRLRHDVQIQKGLHRRERLDAGLKKKTLESTAVNLYIYIYKKVDNVSNGGGVVKREGNESGVGGLGFFRLPHLLSDPSPVKIQSNQTNNYRKKVF